MEHGELRELKHEAVPGYRPALYICLAAGVLFLALSFAGLLGGGH